MTSKIQDLKKHVQSGHLQLAQLDKNNKPVKMQISQLERKTSELNKNHQIYKLISALSWEEKFQWVNTRRLKGNQLFKCGNIEKAIQCYLESLIGCQLSDKSQQRNIQVKLDLQFPILMNIAACFYKLRQYQKGIQICDQVLSDSLGRQYYQALYKKAYFLYELGQFPIAKDILLQLNVKLDKNNTQKKVAKQDVKQLLTKILSKTQEQKTMYRRIFYQQEDDLQSTSQHVIQVPVLKYNQNFIKKSFIWLKETLQSCYKHKSMTYIPTEQEQRSNLLGTKEK